MKKQIILLAAVVVLLSGCIRAKDHLLINEDGSGTLKSTVKIPAGTVQLVDMMFGGFLQAMAESFGNEEEIEQPQSIAEQMFGNKEEMLKKAQERGLQVEFLSYNKEKTSDGINIDYELKFDDVVGLMGSDIVSTKVNISKDSNGNWICEVERDLEEAEKAKENLERFKDFENSPEFQSMNAGMQSLILSAMKDLEVEFQISIPYAIKDVSGIFEQVDENTARLYFSGDFVENPELINKIYGMVDQSSRVVWGAGTIIPMPPRTQERYAPNTKVKVYLKNGEIFEGSLIEQTNDYIKIDLYGVPITYYGDEIDRIE